MDYIVRKGGREGITHISSRVMGHKDIRSCTHRHQDRQDYRREEHPYLRKDMEMVSLAIVTLWCRDERSKKCSRSES